MNVDTEGGFPQGSETQQSPEILGYFLLRNANEKSRSARLRSSTQPYILKVVVDRPNQGSRNRIVAGVTTKISTTELEQLPGAS